MNKLQNAAKTATQQCLSIINSDKVFIITDQETLEVGTALKEAALKLTPNVKMVIIEDFIKRPAKKVPQKLIDEIDNFKPNVSIYAAQGQTGELAAFRGPLKDTYLINKYECRHAHMIGISKSLMEEALNKDYDQIYNVTRKVFNKVKSPEVVAIRVQDSYGTNLTANFDNTKILWIPDDGKITKENWSNLPSGEVFTSPMDANGTYAGWILGDELMHYGELSYPLLVTIENGYITKVEVADNADNKSKEAKKDFEKYIRQYPDGNRLGEFGIGTLVGLEKFVGNLLQDEKFPGSHIAFGHPYPDKTKQTWDTQSHIDIIAKEVTITLIFKDNHEEVIMTDGKFSDQILS